MLRFIWHGHLLGAASVTCVAAAAVATAEGEPPAEAQGIRIPVLSLVPLGLVGAFVVVPLVGAGPPRGGFPRHGAADPAAWFGPYQAQFMIRAGLLEGPALACSFAMFATRDWNFLGAAALMIAALATLVPTRGRVLAFGERSRTPE
jgi:hypothetical protein